MSFAYLPLFTGDYLRDTQHLSMSEHGAYIKLLMFCWDQKGPAPLDERKLCGIVNARSGDELEALRRVLAEFFTRMEDGWYNPRMQREVERSESISHARSDAGKKGYQARVKQLPSKSQAIAKQVHLSPSPSPSLALPLVKEKSRGSRFALTAPPPEWLNFCKTTRPDLDPATTFAKFRDYWTALPGTRGVKLDWFATWRNFVRTERAPLPNVPQQVEWHKSASGVKAKGAELGLVPESFCLPDGRQDWQAFKAAVYERAGVHA